MNSLKSKILSFTYLVIFISACSAQIKDNVPGVKVKIKTTAGNVIIRLYDETPLHQKNFIKLVNEKYYDGVLFHRVIKDFMIQAGDPDSKTATKGQMLGNGGPNYTINAEITPKLIHLPAPFILGAKIKVAIRTKVIAIIACLLYFL